MIGVSYLLENKVVYSIDQRVVNFWPIHKWQLYDAVLEHPFVDSPTKTDRPHPAWRPSAAVHKDNDDAVSVGVASLEYPVQLESFETFGRFDEVVEHEDGYEYQQKS
ncbi:unnamed protein product [Haemonchus placei]|uniref:YccV-like domain-containing protein n=1 Tax=Haemonchus placei TaxID=6290 RepID=A0A0N4WWV9_HAEPC|nr:unnamed protein product [Haemonchus placei]